MVLMPTGTRFAKVLVNFSGKRYLGQVLLPPGQPRASDVLNDGHHFLYLEDVQDGDSKPLQPSLALNKSDITYVQSVDEDMPINPSMIVLGRYLSVDIMMRQPTLHIHGRIFLPDGMDSPSQVINDDRDFLSLRDVKIVGTSERYAYLAVSKAQTISITVAQSAHQTVAPGSD
jgi:hypothetical protein